MTDAGHGVAILIPAAGASRRMGGRDKLMEQVDGMPLLRRQVLHALAAGARVIVTLPRQNPARAAALSGLMVQRVRVSDATEGMAASLRAGVKAARGTAGLMVMPADMPELDGYDLAAMVRHFLDASEPRPILRGMTWQWAAGHPVLFPARHYPALSRLYGDRGARNVLELHSGEVLGFPLPGDAAITDLDTPEAWTDWRARTGQTKDPEDTADPPAEDQGHPAG